MAEILKLKKFRLSKRKFCKAPEHEQVLFLGALEIMTQISILKKALYFSANKRKLPKNIKSFIVTGQLVQVFYFERALAGILYEARKFLNKIKVTDKVLVAKKELINQTFTKKKFLNEITRDKFAYHYDLKVISENLKSICKASDPTLYFAEQNLNSLFLFANQAIYFALIKTGNFKLDEEGLRQASEQMRKELDEISILIMNFFTEFSKQFLVKYLDIQIDKIRDYRVGKVPHALDSFLPYFCAWTERDGNRD